MSLDKFMQEYDQSTVPHPLIPKTRVYIVDPQSKLASYVNFEVSVQDDSISLDFIGCLIHFKRKGLGSKGLKWFLSLADKHQVSVTGRINKTGQDPENLSSLELRRWYKRHGFIFDRHGNGHREPASEIIEYVQG